jgi:hypothetical protein
MSSVKSLGILGHNWEISSDYNWIIQCIKNYSVSSSSHFHHHCYKANTSDFHWAYGKSKEMLTHKTQYRVF